MKTLHIPETVRTVKDAVKFIPPKGFLRLKLIGSRAYITATDNRALYHAPVDVSVDAHVTFYLNRSMLRHFKGVIEFDDGSIVIGNKTFERASVYFPDIGIVLNRIGQSYWAKRFRFTDQFVTYLRANVCDRYGFVEIKRSQSNPLLFYRYYKFDTVTQSVEPRPVTFNTEFIAICQQRVALEYFTLNAAKFLKALETFGNTVIVCGETYSFEHQVVILRDRND